MAEINEQEVLGKIRTLLALERNYMAEERTALAEFRTGLALTVIGPTASTVLAYIFSNLLMEQVLFYDILNFTFFSVLTVIGIWTSFQSRSKLKRIRRQKKILKDREVAVIKCCKTVYDLFSGIMNLEEVLENSF
jgi:uncharacterized membrane protein YidH (DUF202 family)